MADKSRSCKAAVAAVESCGSVGATWSSLWARVTRPSDRDSGERATLTEAEAVRGRQLFAAGRLRRICVPGRHANVAMYAAINATELHALMTSLPLRPWMEVRVEAFAVHPIEAEAAAAVGAREAYDQ